MVAASSTRKFTGERNPLLGLRGPKTCGSATKAQRCGTWSSNSASLARASSRNRRMPEMGVPTSYGGERCGGDGTS